MRKSSKDLQQGVPVGVGIDLGPGESLVRVRR